MGSVDAMDIDVPTEAGPTEETVEALMEYLVGPLLPLKHIGLVKETPSESKQKSVAKQVHAAVVLYNYYHLNRYPGHEFLGFEQFCNLAIMFKPSILDHLKYMRMRQSDRPSLTDPGNQLSLTEKAIVDACTLSETLLKASDNIIKEWKVTKYAVLLVDLKKENCFLKFDNGVWSLIVKELDPKSKKGKKMMIPFDEEDEVWFRKRAFQTVEEVAGITKSDLKVLESDVVYSLSEAKTATRFYVVQNTKPMSDGHLIPIQDIISSLNGPVVKKSSGNWVTTPVVEYYYLLPYAKTISKLFARVSDSSSHQAKCESESGESKKVSDNLQKKSKLDSDDVNTSPVDQNVKKSKKQKVSSDDGGTEQKDTNGSCKAESNNLSSGVNTNIGIDKPLNCEQNETQNTKLEKPLKVYHHERKSTPTNATNNKEDLKDLKRMPTVGQSKEEIVDGEKGSCMANEDRSLALNYTPKDFDSTLDAKKSELSDAALRALMNKRQKLYDQQHTIEGELALCDKKIQAIMLGGSGDCLGLKLEAVIDCCNEICNQDAMQTQHHTPLDVSRSFPLLSGKNLSEAQLTLKKACQELDDICLSNNWRLPTYQTSCSDGGFVANVTLKEPSFECSGVSGVQPSIHEARNSAATHVITRLQQMANGMNAALL